MAILLASDSRYLAILVRSYALKHAGHHEMLSRDFLPLTSLAEGMHLGHPRLLPQGRVRLLAVP